MGTPTGHDSTDLNFMEMLHGLEVHVKYVFDVSERHADVLSQDMLRPLESFNFSCAGKASTGDVPKETQPPRHFEHYFHWLPIPMIVVETMLRAHGHVDFHNSFECCKRSQSVRQLLRTS